MLRRNVSYNFREEQKSLKRASIVIGVIATLIFLLCVAMVAVTLHFTPVMNRFASKFLSIFTRERMVPKMLTNNIRKCFDARSFSS